MSPPAPDIDVSVGLLRLLLLEQHPDLAELELSWVAAGWDNVVFGVGDRLLARMPRRQVAAPLIEHEQAWLPSIAERLSVPVPAPERVGVPSSSYPWHWSIVRRLDGTVAAETSPRSRRSWATELAGFLRELHTPAPHGAPVNPVRGVPLTTRLEAVASRLDSGLIPHADGLEPVWRDALAAPEWAGPPTWVHGDLHPGNILVGAEGLAAVIDFGDLCRGDPATDLATAWLTFDEAGRRSFRDALDYDDGTWIRARGWAVVIATAMVAQSAEASSIRSIGLHAIDQALLQGG